MCVCDGKMRNSWPPLSSLCFFFFFFSLWGHHRYFASSFSSVSASGHTHRRRRNKFVFSFHIFSSGALREREKQCTDAQVSRFSLHTFGGYTLGIHPRALLSLLLLLWLHRPFFFFYSSTNLPTLKKSLTFLLLLLRRRLLSYTQRTYELCVKDSLLSYFPHTRPFLLRVNNNIRKPLSPLWASSSSSSSPILFY